MTEIEKMFKIRMTENDIHSVSELSRITKIEYQRLRDRIKHPENIIIWELNVLNDALHFSDEDWMILTRRGGDLHVDASI